MIQRIKDFVREYQINYHCKRLSKWSKNARFHLSEAERLIADRSPQQIERMERARGLR